MTQLLSKQIAVASSPVQMGGQYYPPSQGPETNSKRLGMFDISDNIERSNAKPPHGIHMSQDQPGASQDAIWGLSLT